MDRDSMRVRVWLTKASPLDTYLTPTPLSHSDLPPRRSYLVYNV